MSADKVGCLGAILRVFGIKVGSATPAQRLPYRLRSDFLSPAELNFYRVLEQAVGERFHISIKVRLWDVIYVPRGKDNHSFENKIRSKHLDFLLCDRQSLQPRLAIELDDASHKREDRRDRDQFVDQALDAAGLAILHVRAANSYAPVELKQQIENQISSTSKDAPPLPVPAVSAVNSSCPSCPKCQSSMVERKATRGSHAGKRFWACSNYPDCRGIVSID